MEFKVGDYIRTRTGFVGIIVQRQTDGDAGVSYTLYRRIGGGTYVIKHESATVISEEEYLIELLKRDGSQQHSAIDAMLWNVIRNN